MPITKIRQEQIKNLKETLSNIKNQIKGFKPPVDLIENLPIENNNNGDLRVCLEDGNIYIWNETEAKWNLSSGKSNSISYVKTLDFTITEDEQSEINTKIRFDGTTDLQTTAEIINVYLNGMLTSKDNYDVENINDELIIKWKDEEKLMKNDIINVQYYDVTGGIGDGSNYVHPETHPVSMITGLHDCATSGDADTLNGKSDTDFASNADLLALSGQNTTNLGAYTHSEGNSTNKATDIITNLSTSTSNDDIKTVWGTSKFSLAKGDYSHIEGENCLALGNFSHAEGNDTIASGKCSHAEGDNTIASGNFSHAEGDNTIASGNFSHAEGSKTTVLGNCSHIEGASFNKANVIITDLNSNTTNEAIIEAWKSRKFSLAKGTCSHVEGTDCLALSDYCHTGGYRTIASGKNSQTQGINTTAETYLAHIQGQYNKVNTGNSTSYSTTNNAFVIGNGTITNLSNAFRITFDGKTYGLSAFNSTGADYAEYFEWEDGNPDNEDRIGKFVTLDSKKIRIANSNDDYILGIVSGNCSVIGNAHEDTYHEMYMRDKFGRFIYEDVEVEYENEKGEKEIRIEKHIKLNPNYDNTKEYIPRSERSEWDVIGMLGQIVVIDDGTCKINGYCTIGENGKATESDKGYKVIDRIDEETIIILFK